MMLACSLIAGASGTSVALCGMQTTGAPAVFVFTATADAPAVSVTTETAVARVCVVISARTGALVVSSTT